MIAFISICYGLLYFLIFNKFGLLKKTVGNICSFAGVGVVMIGAIIFMWYTFSPMSGDARMFRYVLPIVPKVRGEVVSVPIEPLQMVAAGETLFQIDPEPFEISIRQIEGQVRRYEAELRLAEVNMERASKLLKMQSAAQIDMDTWTANRDAAQAAIDSSEAQLDDARWQLKKSTVVAPYEGYVVNLQLRPGATVTTVPLASPMAFVSSESNLILSSLSQSAARHVAVGDAVDLVFTSVPGQTFSGKILRIVSAGAQSQLTASNQLPSLSGARVTDRWAVVSQLDDEEFARNLPQGAGGAIAIYTAKGKPVHVISKVAIRINAWLGYLTAP